MSVSFDFTGKVVLVTGSSSGIGSETAIQFARSGAKVVVTGRNEKNVLQVSRECDQVSPNGSQSLPVVADVTKEEDMQRLVDKTIEKFGKLDVLVNNAGFGIPCSVTDPKFMTAYRSVLETNLSSVVFMTHLCAQHLAKTKGNIINISSIASMMAAEGISAYPVSKSALDMFTKCMAIELAPLGIRVNSINPGCVRTPIIERMGMPSELSDKMWDMYGSRYPVGRCGEPVDIAKVIMYLACDASSFITGTIMVVDGGHTVASVKLDTKEMLNMQEQYTNGK